MKRFIGRLYKKLDDISLDTRIRLSYLLVILPLVFFVLFCVIGLWKMNLRYDDLVASNVRNQSAAENLRSEIRLYYSQMLSLTVAAFAAVLFISTLVAYIVSRSITSPVKRLSRIAQRVARGELSLRAPAEGGEELEELANSMNMMIVRTNKLVKQVTREQTRLRNAELELLQSQINPHFLYNTLDTIVWLAEAGDQANVVSMVGNLSEFFRTSLSRGRDIINVSEELKHVMSYLQIQQVRYQDIMEFSVDMPQELYSQEIPKVTIQPLVENALYHGVKNRRGMGKITVWGERMGSFFNIYVSDNGIGMKPERLGQVIDRMNSADAGDDEMFGLRNVNERIRLKFGNRYGLHVDSEYMKGTIVTVMLPYK